MRQFLPRTFAAIALCLCLAPSTEAGLIPWTFDALFGPPGSLQQWWAGYPNGNPYTGGYGGGGYGTMYGTGYRGWYGGGGYGYATPSYGYSNCCSPVTANYYTSSYGDCGCNPCGGYGCGSCSGGCASGNCASGDCGTGSNYSPEPTPDVVPRTFKKEDGTNTSDDFRPLQPRESTDEILPNQGGDFQSPRPAPGEPGSGDDILPRGVLRPEAEGAYVKPIEVETTVARSYQPQRHRIVMSAGYRLPTVARVQVAPKAKSDQTQIAANE